MVHQRRDVEVLRSRDRVTMALAMQDMQNTGWCSVGRSGKHKHEPAERVLARSNTGRCKLKWQRSAIGQQVKQADPNREPTVGLASLPGTALASIFHIWIVLRL